MPCFYPMQGYRGKELTQKGKRKLVFSSSDAIDTSKLFQVTVGCGQCVGCRLERSRQWAVRCMHEASLYGDDNCFITLTYSDENLPKGNSLVVRDFQNFMKRLRFEFKGVHSVTDSDGNVTNPIRFFHCGEYGDKYGRPHYHACIFNFDFSDKYRFSVCNGLPLYRSETLERLWPYGLSSIGTVTFDSAAYVARYIMKKKFGKSSWIHYSDIDWNTGEVLFERKPEYVTMSRRPGIGRNWIDEYMDDTYKDDFIVLNDGRKVLPPKYYDSQFELFSPSDFEKVKSLRVRNALKHADNNTAERLRVRETVLKSKLKCVPRKLDGDL